MTRTLLVAIAMLTFLVTASSQNTVGLLSYDFTQTYNGYNLIYPHNQPNVYLLNNCGEIVNVWTDVDTLRPGNTAYLTDEGNLVKTKRSASVQNDPIWAGGGGGIVEIRSWDNDLLWTFTLNDSLMRLHHDIEPLPNGNILMITWDNRTMEEAIEAGRDPDALFNGELWSESIIEVMPIGDDSFEIVWQWDLWDHLVQDFDNTKDNFGDVGASPGKLDINFQTNNGQADWLHSNAIDYNPFLDQIMLCTPFLREVYIIDHSTTTEQAQGIMGDFMFRWGNNQAFRQGTEDDQQLFNPHDAHWIDDFVPGSHPDAGKIAVFNNQAGPNYSSVNIISPLFDMYTGYAKNGDVYSPADFDWTYVHPDSALTHSTGLSSIQVLPNGNTLVGVGRTGYSYELNPDEDIIWEYRTPLKAGQAVSQGDTLVLNDNLTFRIKRYPVDFDGFAGRDLSPKGFIELDPDTSFCDITSSVDDPADAIEAYVYPNPVSNVLTVEWMSGGMGLIEVFDYQGRLAHKEDAYGGRTYVNVAGWYPGIYFVRINGSAVGKVLVAGR